MNAFRPALAAALLASSCALHAQSGNRITEPSSSPPSRWQQDKEQLDSAHAIARADGDRSAWIVGFRPARHRRSGGARAARMRRRAIRRPRELLYLTSLAVACLEPVQPRYPECDTTDRLADWATRDIDNGIPMLLLADRARQRNNATAVVAFLEEAALRPRFDDYSNRGTLLLWEEVRALPGSTEPAARAELAAAYGAAQPSSTGRAMQALCRDAAKATEGMRSACTAAGTAAAQRAATWSLRAAGARMAERNAEAGAAQTAAAQLLSDIQHRAFECAEAGNPVALALESTDPAARARAVGQWEQRIAQDARVGEVVACAGSGAPAKG